MCTNKTATLVCEVIAITPAEVSISWRVDGKERADGVQTGQATKFGSQYLTVSRLTSSVAEWDSGVEYSCSVQDNQLDTPLSKRTRNTKEECFMADINAIIKRPSFEEIWMLRRATIVCEVVYTDLQNVTVSWQVNGSRRMNGVETRGPERRGNKSVIISKLKISVEEWNSGTEYLCFVEDRDLPTPLTIASKKNKVTEMHRPKAYLLYPSAEEIQAEEAATLICLVTGFYPEDIYVGWMANDNLLHSGFSTQFNSDKENGSNSVTSKLRISAEDWEKGTTYSCLVGHPSLKTNIVRSINKSQGKPTLVNVSVVLTDSFKSCA